MNCPATVRGMRPQQIIAVAEKLEQNSILYPTLIADARKLAADLGRFGLPEGIVELANELVESLQIDWVKEVREQVR